MAFALVAAGIYHFVNPKMYKRIMPPWIPFHYQLIAISGLIEIILGLLLLLPATRTIAAWGIIVFLLAVFPANIQMAINFRQRNNPYLWVALLRLPLQFALMYWAWQYTW